MIKCPNCGSTTQVTVEYISPPDSNHIIQRIVCGCGCITNSVFEFVVARTWTENGTLIKKTIRGSE